MESDRVEMSVGGGMVNGDHASNGVTANGAAINGTSSNSKSVPLSSTELYPIKNGVVSHTNGVSSEDQDGSHDKNTTGILKETPPELLQMISTDFYLPMAKLVSRSAQSCWNDLAAAVERLSQMPVPAQTATMSVAQVNEQSRVNMDKKDVLLNFASDHKAVFIKLMVLLQWSKRGEDVRKTIELNFWLAQRRQAFNNATSMLGQMMRDLAGAQIPNPDLYTAGEVLSLGQVPELPELDYIPQPPLSSKQILRTLKRLNYILRTRLSLEEAIPAQLSEFYVHDGRATFTVSDEFELDLSLMDEDPESKYLLVDLRFLFSPAPSIPEALHDRIASIANSIIEREGLTGVYNFLHDLTLSYKLNEFHKQAQDLAQSLWAGNLKVDMLRRTLVVQYWLKKPGKKSWLEIGIHSGKTAEQIATQGLVGPHLRLAWHRDGKPVQEHEITLNLSRLSIQDILRQVIAQHANYVFDAVYEKISMTPLYANAELSLEQSASLADPGDCRMDIQLSKADNLRVTLEPVSGNIVLSPVNERTSRTQYELSRSKNNIEDFMLRLPALRCSIAQSNLFRSMSNSVWQRLEGLNPTTTEIGSLFTKSVLRASFFRQKSWTLQWMLAVTQSETGDHWWITQKARDMNLLDSRLTEIVKSRPLHLEGHLSPAYLERLADYTSGVIVLQSNAQFLSKKAVRYGLATIPPFGDTYKLPSLQFTYDLKSMSRTIESKPLSASHPAIELSYRGVNQRTGKAIVVARTIFNVEAKVLSELAASQLDDSIFIAPATKQVLIRAESEVGLPIVHDILSKLSHLENIIACATTVNRSKEHTLQSLSLSAITIAYAAGSKNNLRFTINFATAAHGLDVTFLPIGENPHSFMAAHAKQILTKPGKNLSRRLEDVLGLLKLTQPMLSFLFKLQSDFSSFPSSQSAPKATEKQDLVRVHVLTRQAATYGVQYFARSSNFVHDNSDTETPKKLLVRLEIIPLDRSERLMWLVRPAIEEFNAYQRPSYTSNALRIKLKEEIFSKFGSKDWLPLDTGAACPSDKPEAMLLAIHNIILQWVAEAVRPETAEEAGPVVAGNKINGNNETKTKSQSNSTAKPQQASQQQQPRVNGVQHQGQRPGMQNSNSQRNKSMQKQQHQHQEVITLE